MRLFCARGSSLPVVAAAERYRVQTGENVEVALCGEQCAAGGAHAHGFYREVADGEFDLAVGGSETDMDELDQAGKLAAGSRRSLGLREATILTPAGNPARVVQFDDLARPGVRIGISTVDCLRGVWEDVCGRAGCIPQVRRNVQVRVPGCMAIIRALSRGEVDAAFGWSAFVHFDPRLEVVPLPPDVRVRRATAAAILRRCDDHERAVGFLNYLCSAEGQQHFTSRGWIAT